MTARARHVERLRDVRCVRLSARTFPSRPFPAIACSRLFAPSMSPSHWCTDWSISERFNSVHAAVPGFLDGAEDARSLRVANHSRVRLILTLARTYLAKACSVHTDGCEPMPRPRIRPVVVPPLEETRVSSSTCERPTNGTNGGWLHPKLHRSTLAQHHDSNSSIL